MLARLSATDHNSASFVVFLLSLPFCLCFRLVFVFVLFFHPVTKFQLLVSPGEDELALSLVQRLRTSPSSEQPPAAETAADRVAESRSLQVTSAVASVD